MLTLSFSQISLNIHLTSLKTKEKQKATYNILNRQKKVPKQAKTQTIQDCVTLNTVFSKQTNKKHNQMQTLKQQTNKLIFHLHFHLFIYQFIYLNIELGSDSPQNPVNKFL